MQPSPAQLLYYRVKETTRAAVRQILLYIFACSVLVAWWSGALDDKYFNSHPLSLTVFTALVLGAPLGVLAFLAIRLLRFAFRR